MNQASFNDDTKQSFPGVPVAGPGFAAPGFVPVARPGFQPPPRNEAVNGVANGHVGVLEDMFDLSGIFDREEGYFTEEAKAYKIKKVAESRDEYKTRKEVAYEGTKNDARISDPDST
ncbi:hypothetical protein BGZ91_009953, partial [Linnemannia elongata]